MAFFGWQGARTFPASSFNNFGTSSSSGSSGAKRKP